MAPQGRKGQPSEGTAHSSDSEEDVVQPSQDDVVKKAENILAQGRRRREGKRKAIEAEHAKRVKEVRTKMENLYAVRKTKVSKLQSNCWESLEALNSKRESLEKAILSSMRTVERHTMNVASEITYILEHRLEEISTMDELGASVGRAKIADPHLEKANVMKGVEKA